MTYSHEMRPGILIARTVGQGLVARSGLWQNVEVQGAELAKNSVHFDWQHVSSPRTATQLSPAYDLHGSFVVRKCPLTKYARRQASGEPSGRPSCAVEDSSGPQHPLRPISHWMSVEAHVNVLARFSYHDSHHVFPSNVFKLRPPACHVYIANSFCDCVIVHATFRGLRR